MRARTQLSTLVGRSVKLVRKGREWAAPCPFHDERTPSFYVNDDKGFYHCFGCGAHGDAIRWLTDQQGLPFLDAVKELAAAAGMTVPAPDPKAAKRAERASTLHDVCAAAERWFVEQLGGEDGGEARGYLQRRGAAPKLAEEFALGFAPDRRNALRTALARFGDPLLVEAGLLIHIDDKEPYDRFRGRLMIPIHDARGRTIGFGGRLLGEGEPKYLNSPDTPLFDKGRTLWNLHRAAPAARKANRLIVVEGYLDAIALAGAGVAEVVAPLGTALTEAQLELLWRQVEVPILCFDGDTAGQKAAMRAATRALPLLGPERSLAFVTLPPGQDPDDLVRAGGRVAVDALLSDPQPLADRLWEAERAAKPLRSPEARAGLKARLDAQVEAIGHNEVRRHYARQFKERFDAEFFARREWGRRDGPTASTGARTISGSGIEPVFERPILAGLVRHPAVIQACAETLAVLRFTEPRADRLRATLVEASYDAELVETSQLDSICNAAGLAEVLSELRALRGPAFSFMRRTADPGVARRDLALAIEAVAVRPELERALKAATARLAGGGDEACFAEQAQLTRARLDNDRQLQLLLGHDEDER